MSVLSSKYCTDSPLYSPKAYKTAYKISHVLGLHWLSDLIYFSLPLSVGSLHTGQAHYRPALESLHWLFFLPKTLYPRSHSWLPAFFNSAQKSASENDPHHHLCNSTQLLRFLILYSTFFYFPQHFSTIQFICSLCCFLSPSPLEYKLYKAENFVLFIDVSQCVVHGMVCI